MGSNSSQLATLSLLFGTYLASISTAQISDRNVSYSWLPPNPAQSESVEAVFTSNPASDINVMFEQWWAYRVSGDTDETYLNSTNLSQTSVGTHADLDWSDLDGRGLLRAELDLDVASTGAISGTIVARLTLTNTSSNVLTVNLFHYLDLDVCVALPNNASGSGFAHSVAGNCADFDSIGVDAMGADRFCITPFTGSECGIASTGIRTLPDTGLPFGPGDYSSAFQWQDRVLPPSGVLIALVAVHHNPPACAGLASSTSYGNASPPNPQWGTPGLSSAPPVVGHLFRLDWDHTEPNAPGALLVGDARASFVLSNLLVHVVPVFDLPIASDAAGLGGLSFAILDSSLCGVLLDFQAFFLDPTAMPFAIRHSAGLEIVFGR